MNRNNAKRKLLLIDDDEASRTLIKEIYEGAKIKIIESTYGMEAFDLYKAYSWELDLVLLDIKLPDCNGWELLKDFRQVNPLVPLIAVSAISPSELRRRCSLADIDAYLSKPFEIKELKKLVRIFLKV